MSNIELPENWVYAETKEGPYRKSVHCFTNTKTLQEKKFSFMQIGFHPGVAKQHFMNWHKKTFVDDKG